jgi:hypothetical protein
MQSGVLATMAVAAVTIAAEGMAAVQPGSIRMATGSAIPRRKNWEPIR